MARVLITGMSGVGKTTLLDALASLGHATVDTDYEGWTLDQGPWDEPRMAALLASHETIAVAGTVENQGRVYDSFQEVVLLSAPLDILLARVRSRTSNPYGRTPEHEAEIRANVRDIEPLLRDGATVQLDATRPVQDLAAIVEDMLRR